MVELLKTSLSGCRRCQTAGAATAGVPDRQLLTNVLQAMMDGGIAHAEVSADSGSVELSEHIRTLKLIGVNILAILILTRPPNGASSAGTT